MFLSRREEVRYTKVAKAVVRWNRDFAPVPFYRRPSIHEVAYLAGLYRVTAHEVETVFKSLQEE